jgi:hypothetical protein
MATRKFTQNNFTQGQVGPYLFGRGETPIYKAGLETCENFICLPQGGIAKRKGFKFISANPDSSTTPDGSTALTTVGFHDKSRIIPFQFSDAQEYVIILEPSDSTTSTSAKMHIYYNDVRLAVITDGVSGNVFPISTSMIDEVRFTQSFDVMILVHPDMAPVAVIRGSATTDWTAGYLEFDHYPMANFDFDATLAPSAKTSSCNLTLAGGTYRWVDAAFPNGHVGMYVNINGGQVKIDSITSSTVAAGTVIYELVDTATAQGHEWEITAFNNLPATLGGGYPRTVSFHQNRLIFGGSRDKPQTIFGSQSGDFFNFDPYTRIVTDTTVGGVTTTNITGEVTDDAALTFTVASNKVNLIRHLVSQQSLFIFTSDGEFDLSGEPVTPTNVTVREQTRYGTAAGKTEPKVVDNEVLFVQKGGKQLRAFVYNFNTDAYSAKNYSLVHHNILSGATQAAYLKNYDNINNNFVFVINGDGTLAVLGINTEYSVVGWMSWSTNGFFKDLGVVDDKLYALVKRYDNDGSTQNAGLFLERLTEDAVYLDGYHTTNISGSSFTGAVGLEGKTVQVVADGLVHPDVTVNAAGSFTLTRTSADTQIGYGYTSTMKTLPVQVASANLSTLGERVRKVMCEIQFYESEACKIDGITIPFQSLDAALLNQPITPFTGQKRMRVSGWSRTPQITITSDQALPVTILSLTTEIKFGTGKLQEAG